jgi:4'-phosphopantetheinyl transferase EntD
MNDLDASHETVRALEQLVPEAVVAGGSFAGWLPHPSAVPSADRSALLASAHDRAVACCMRSLLVRSGIDEDTTIATGDGGNREWPRGFVGSLTHKGTVVLGAIATSVPVQLIGIDLERLDRADLGDIEAMVAPEGLPSGIDAERGTLVSFSAKEAVFKAQFPATRRRLEFSDVQLIWTCDGENMRAAVRCPVAGLVVRASFVGRWVVAAATLIN